MDRRRFLQSGIGAGVTYVTGIASTANVNTASRSVPCNKCLKVILNNDSNNILYATSGKDVTVQEYRRAVDALLDAKPRVLAQDVGNPDPVIYRSKVATILAKYIVEVSLRTWPKEDPVAVRRDAERQADAMRKLEDLGTDALAITIDACRRRGTLIVPSYRMNAEDWYHNSWMLSDFGRAHQGSLIPETGALDPKDPVVFEHRRRIFREVAENYDIDGIEFDYMRWTHMISDPHKNYPILTREVEETRRMLNEVARHKGRARMILGVRVGYSLDGPPAGKSDFSCKDLGLDVKTWIQKGLVDYVCPSYFWPRLPGMPQTAEFVALAKGTQAGIYPTVFPYAKWQDEPNKSLIAETNKPAMQELCEEICRAALQGYADGADGISTFNWVPHQQPGMVFKPMREEWGLGSKKVQMLVHQKLGDPKELRECLKDGCRQL